MMPRFSPPTATGLPRRRESAACSTDAKKASASRWTMTQGTSQSFAFADERDHDALDNEFLRRDEVGIAGVFGTKEGLAPVQEEGLERAFVVDERRHHIPVAWRHAVFQDHEIAVHNALPHHRVTPNFKGE